MDTHRHDPAAYDAGGAVVVTHGMQAHMAWVGQYIPSDFLHINATQAEFVTTSEATTVRIPAQAQVDASR